MRSRRSSAVIVAAPASFCAEIPAGKAARASSGTHIAAGRAQRRSNAAGLLPRAPRVGVIPGSFLFIGFLPGETFDRRRVRDVWRGSATCC